MKTLKREEIYANEYRDLDHLAVMSPIVLLHPLRVNRLRADRILANHRLLGEGHHYKTAATELGISVHTVRFHLRSIYSKLEVHSKSEAVAKALREGLIR
jgi:ATP/maltotriose-dependent transcriptional regulator MalT